LPVATKELATLVQQGMMAWATLELLALTKMEQLAKKWMAIPEKREETA
jgi:hypothetical protein